MASSLVMGEILRHLRKLFGDGTTVGAGDAQLLACYAASRDEAAFATLVARHGPMVLATCRAVLNHEQDVEDAFQATFLVLARKARSVNGGDALGGWLHRVAYRGALRARAAARRRRDRETKVAAMAPLHSVPVDDAIDLAAIVYEEVDRLAEKHRLPVVLCDLEGLTYEQAAGCLRWTLPTLRGRLVKARQHLKDRLERRGVTAPALATFVAAQATAVKVIAPAALVRAAVAAAISGTASVSVAAFASAILRNLFLSKLKLVSASVLAAIVLVSASAVAIAPRPGKARLAMAPPNAPKAQSAVPPTPTGPGLEGRILDLEGQPVAGARVEVASVFWAPDGDLGRWLDRAREYGLQHPSEGLNSGGLPTVRDPSEDSGPTPANSGVITDANGRFHLTGVGRDQIAKVRVSGPTIATTDLYAMGRDGAEVRAKIHQGLKPDQVVFHARRFDQVVPMSRPIQGVIRDSATGQPIAGVALAAAVYEEHSMVPQSDIEARTDAQGRYRLVGLPRASAYRLFVEPAPGQPYPKATFRAPGDGQVLEPVTFDMALKRGIVVRGKVTDKATGQPVGFVVDVFAFADNPHIREFPGYQSSPLPRYFAKDGQYEAVALPGRTLIGVLTGGYKGLYRRSVGARPIDGYNPELMQFSTIPQLCFASNYNTLAEIDIDPKAETVTVDLQVDPGRTIEVTPIDPEGRPVAGTVAFGICDTPWMTAYPQNSSKIEVVALDPSSPRRVTVVHGVRKLIGSVYLKGAEDGPLTIPLQPWGTIIGRIIDDNGQPRGGFVLRSPRGFILERPSEQGILPGGDSSAGVRIGRDGRFRVEGLVPGLKYAGGVWAGLNNGGGLFHDVTTTPGEVKDLGDLKIVPYPRND